MSFADLFPEIVYETYCISSKKKPCFVCGSKKAISVLRSVEREIIPLCKDCSFKWNFYSIEVLKAIRPKQLVWNLLKFKLLHWFGVQSLYRTYKDLKVFQEWEKKNRKFSD